MAGIEEAKVDARQIIATGQIDDPKRFNRLLDFLKYHSHNDPEAADLLSKLQPFKQTQSNIIPDVPYHDDRPAVSRRGGVFNMKHLGILVILLGVAIGIYAAQMDVTVTTAAVDYGYGISIPSMRVNNIGLMDERRNILIVAGFVALAGTIIFAVGHSRES
jgi:hypothetical protein